MNSRLKHLGFGQFYEWENTDVTVRNVTTCVRADLIGLDSPGLHCTPLAWCTE